MIDRFQYSSILLSSFVIKSSFLIKSSFVIKSLFVIKSIASDTQHLKSSITSSGSSARTLSFQHCSTMTTPDTFAYSRDADTSTIPILNSSEPRPSSFINPHPQTSTTPIILHHTSILTSHSSSIHPPSTTYLSVKNGAQIPIRHGHSHHPRLTKIPTQPAILQHLPQALELGVSRLYFG